MPETLTHTFTITWGDNEGAEPSHIFNSFSGKVFELGRGVPYDPILIVWDHMAQTDDGDYIVHGWVHDPETGDWLDLIDIPLSDIRSVRYL